jgi:aminoglycoside phosphotransferase (APT) family kinase protein
MVQDATMISPAGSQLPGWLTERAASLTAAGETVVEAARLRHWGLSEVWRIRLGGPAPRSMIVKRATGGEAAEARRYRQLVIPLALPAPRLIAASGGEDGDPVVLVLQDVGRDTLEQRPTADGYRAATHTLVRMRADAARRLADDPSIAPGLRRTTVDLLDTAHRVQRGVATLRPDLAGALDGATRVLAGRLDRLAGAPETIVHGDFHAKNLIHGRGGRIVAVDWPGAYVHAHLGDLYSLLREAQQKGIAHDVGAAALPAVFAREAAIPATAVSDQLVTGGLCWTFRALRWVVDEGVEAVPESRGWLDELVADCRTLAAKQAVG